MHYGTPGQPVQVSAAGGTDLRWGTYRVPMYIAVYLRTHVPSQATEEYVYSTHTALAPL